MDNDFCVLKGLIGMYGKGVYYSAVVKKRRYLPAGIYQDQTNAHFFK